MADQLPPLILCMENATGEEVSLHIEPNDDFQAFLDKARSLLGYDVDINSITKNQPVSLKDNIYQFLLNAEQDFANVSGLTQNFEQMLQPNDNNDMIYFLDDGTQINASQIHFDNEDPPVDLTAEKIPFIKYIDDGIDEGALEDSGFDSTKLFNIKGSPNSKISSPKCGFVNTLPFKLVCSDTAAFEAQFTKYLETSDAKTYTTLNTVDTQNKSPRSLIKEGFKTYEDSATSEGKNAKNYTITREEILNMFKDPPVSIPYESKQNSNEKRRHVRKTDPSKPGHKSYNVAPKISLDIFEQSESRVCIVCEKRIVDELEKSYLFSSEDQMCGSSQKKSENLKVVCVKCLAENFKECRNKCLNEPLNNNEYVIIRNNQQYIFQSNDKFNMKLVNNNILKSLVGDAQTIKGVENFPKVTDKNLKCDDTISIKDNEGSSSDVEIIEPEPEIEEVIENLDEADEEVQEFLGKCQQDDEGQSKEMKCRFCKREFAHLSEVMDHGEEHKHDVDKAEVFPCPLCDYGYANIKWLKGHIKAAHDKVRKEDENKEDSVEEIKTKVDSPIAKRTRSCKKTVDDEYQKDNDKNTAEDQKNISTLASAEHTLTVKTEVKQECLDSSDEEAIWIVQTADQDDKVLKDILKSVEGKQDSDGGAKKLYKCDVCEKMLDTESFPTHHCRRKRGRKRKTVEKEDDVILCVPSEEDFIRRAQGRRVKPEPRPSVVGGPRSAALVLACDHCGQTFSSKVRLKFHMQFHEDDGQGKATLSCAQCEDVSFATEAALFDHVHFTHHKRKRWQCPVAACGKTFHLRATLTKHSRTHTDTRRYVCVTCGKRFLDKQTLDEHGVTHLQIKPFQCHICLKQLTRRSRLRMHLRAHEEELCLRLVLVCAVCGRAFRDHQDAQEHATVSMECIESFAKELKEETEEPTVCLSPTSGLVRQTVKIIESPRLAKSVQRQVDSPQAETMLQELSDEARSIIRVVEIEKAFRCEYCEDVFYLDESLNSHRSIHKGIKNPFTCHICKVSFATYSRCTTHKTTHGFYKRPVVDASKPSDGKQDAMSSTGILGYGGFPVVKHFLCEDCGRSYLHWTYLQVHRRMKHANENYLYKCNICNITFPNSWSVTYHRRKVHGKLGQGVGESASSYITKIVKENHRIPCRDCSEVLPNKTALYKHRKKEHSDMSLHFNSKTGSPCYSNGTPVACAQCGDSFPTASELHAHLKSARGCMFQFPCMGCGKIFVSHTELVKHSRSNDCFDSYRAVSSRGGLRSHGTQRPYKRASASRGRMSQRARASSLLVLEVIGLNPTPEEVMEQLTNNKIPHDKVIEITKMSFTKELSQLNVQLLLHDGVLMDGNEIVQLQMGDSTLPE